MCVCVCQQDTHNIHAPDASDDNNNNNNADDDDDDWAWAGLDLEPDMIEALNILLKG